VRFNLGFTPRQPVRRKPPWRQTGVCFLSEILANEEWLAILGKKTLNEPKCLAAIAPNSLSNWLIFLLSRAFSAHLCFITIPRASPWLS
jgi:hypothetical protein